MLDQRRRRWINIKLALFPCLVFAEMNSGVIQNNPRGDHLSS